jgi:6-phosphogluconolactonase
VTAELRVVDDVAEAAAEVLAEAARAGGHVALSGGGTVGRAYGRAAELAPDWGSVEVWWGDDRAVPPDDPDSNYRLVREHLLDRLEVQPVVHRIHGELGPDAAALRYDRELDGTVLDLALNGIGPDGHTASLYPFAPALEERERRVVAVEAGLEPWVPRVTMTPPVFAQAALLVYVVEGEAKAEAVRRAFGEAPSPATPASLIRGRRTVAILDPAAASLLPS